MTAGPRVLHYLGNRGMTGVETFVLTLAEAQRAQGIDARITCHPAGREELVKLAAARGVPLVTFGLAGPRPENAVKRKLQRAWLSVRRVLELVRLLRAMNADVIHAHPVGMGTRPAFVAGKLAGVRVVVTHHTTLQYVGVMSRAQKATFALEKLAADRIVMPYRAAADEMRDKGGIAEARLAVVPFCVDGRKFAYEERPRRDGGPLRVLLSARLIEGKGHPELIEAARRLGDAVQVTLAGDGPARAAVDAAAAGVANVRVLGHVGFERMAGLMREADVVALPSYMSGETFPVSLLEAAILGVPAVATRWFGIPAIVADGETGILVEPRDAAGLTAALERLARDRDVLRRMGLKARERALREFEAGVVARRYAELYARGA